MNEQAYQDQMEDDAQFEAEQSHFRDEVYTYLADCMAIVREMIIDELTSNVSHTRWSKIEDTAIAMQDLEGYLDREELENAFNEIRNYV